MESGTQPSTTMKIKNPKKVEAGRKAAMARAKKLDELERLAAANQQRVHAEIAKDSSQGGGGDAAYEEPAPSQSSRRAARQWYIQTEWLAGGALLLIAGYILYIKNRETKSGPSVPAPGVTPPTAPPPTAPPPTAPPPTAKAPAASSAAATPQPERRRQMYVKSME
jgi:hypothetical protein